MTNPLKALKWRICGSYDPDGPVTENSPDRVQNRAKYEVWKYNTLGPGRGVYGKEYAYQIVDSGELSREPLYLNDPWYIAAMASIIAEMQGHREIAFREPRVMPTDRQEALEKIAREEDQAIDRVVSHYRFTYNPNPLGANGYCKANGHFRAMLDTLLKQH